MSNILGIIPARYESTRLPGKPLAMIGNKPMIQHVYERCHKALRFVYVATDDERIFDAVESFGGKVVMTSVHHQNGTERCAEAAKLVSMKEKTNFDVIFNIQGDEPFIDITQIRDLKKCFNSRDVQIATLIQQIDDPEHLFNENEAKVIVNPDSEAIYFSRSAIPFVRNAEKDEWPERHDFYRHIGIYGYRPGILLELVTLKPTPLEIAESLEQLRWIENGYKIKCGITQTTESICVDTLDDLNKANELYNKLNNG